MSNKTEKKQTAVEWLESQFANHDEYRKKVFEQAKELEKQQIIDAFTSGEKDILNVFIEEFKNRGLDLEIGNINDDNEDAEQYYADTFK